LAPEVTGGLVGQAFARRGRDAQHVEDALGFGGVVGDDILALRVRYELTVGLPILFFVTSTPFQIDLRRRRPRWRRNAIGKGKRWWRRRIGRARRAGRRQRARAVVEALDLVGDHGRTFAK